MAVFLLASCATPYYGYSKQEWQKLTEVEKKAAQKEYEEIIRFKYHQKHEDQLEDRKQSVINRGLIYELR